MRLRPDVIPLVVVCAMLLAAPSASAAPPDDVTIRQAIDKVKTDPDLSTTRTIKSLKWKAASAFAMDFRPGNWA